MNINNISEKGTDISIIMPALNEENNIQHAISSTLEAFAYCNINGEIIVVNDGSADKTENLVRDLSGSVKCLRLLNHEVPQGIGASFWDGVDNARGNTICMLPGDNENDPLEIFRYYNLLEHVDIVIPFVYNNQMRSFYRSALSFVYRFIVNSTFLVNLNYTNGTILYKKSILKELEYRSSGFFFQTDILIRLIKRGYLFAEVPYRLGQRKGGISKAVSFPSLIQVIKGYIRLTRDQYYARSEKETKEFLDGTVTAKRSK